MIAVRTPSAWTVMLSEPPPQTCSTGGHKRRHWDCGVRMFHVRTNTPLTSDIRPESGSQN